MFPQPQQVEESREASSLTVFPLPKISAKKSASWGTYIPIPKLSSNSPVNATQFSLEWNLG